LKQDLINKKYFYQKIEAKNFILKEFPISAEINEDSFVSGKNRSFMKIMQPECNNVLLNTSISVDNQQFYLQEINNFLEGEDYSSGNQNFTLSSQIRHSLDDNISLENLQKVDFKKCFYKQPSQMALGRKEGNLALSSEIDNIGNLKNLKIKNF
jgi:hypothetical protein